MEDIYVWTNIYCPQVNCKYKGKINRCLECKYRYHPRTTLYQEKMNLFVKNN